MPRPSLVLCLCVTFVAAGSVHAQYGPAQVEVESVVRREVAPTIRLVGTLHPNRRAVIAADVDGLVVAMPVDYGAIVEAGAPLCELRDATRRWAVDEARARIAAIESDLAARRADTQKTGFEFERVERLFKLKQSSDMERVNAEANHIAAQARVREAEGMLDEARAALERSEDDLARTRITAPFDGAITSKLTELGQWVTVGGPVVEMVDLSVVRARVAVPESAIAFCAPGEATQIHVDALGRDFEGAVSRVIPDADLQANTFPMDIDIPNPDRSLKSGMFVRAMVPAGPKVERLLVPKDAVITRGPTSMIYIAKAGEKGHTADIAPVTVVAEVMQYVAVESPVLQPGDLAIVRGNEGLRGPGPIIVMSGLPKENASEGNSRAHAAVGDDGDSAAHASSAEARDGGRP